MNQGGNLLLDHNAKLADRMKTVFEIRTNNNTPEGRNIMKAAVEDKRNGTLLRHEVAFALGQMQHEDCNECLIRILGDFEDDVIVRHEAAEALGAIGSKSSLDILNTCLNRKGEKVEVYETCLLSKKKIEEDSCEVENEFNTVDPADPLTVYSVAELEKILTDEDEEIHKRYSAMFSLRNMNNDEATLALCKGLLDKKSALFRHEIAYVLGQLENPVSFEALAKCLQRADEHEMVRHEAAEALGAIDDPAAISLLKKYSDDASQIVRESCVIAVSANEYWRAFENQGTTGSAN